jgi:hypothetical protein
MELTKQVLRRVAQGGRSGRSSERIGVSQRSPRAVHSLLSADKASRLSTDPSTPSARRATAKAAAR